MVVERQDKRRMIAIFSYHPSSNLSNSMDYSSSFFFFASTPAPDNRAAIAGRIVSKVEEPVFGSSCWFTRFETFATKLASSAFSIYLVIERLLFNK